MILKSCAKQKNPKALVDDVNKLPSGENFVTRYLHLGDEVFGFNKGKV